MVIGGLADSGPVVPEDPVEASDIDGDGEVGFSDFIQFAGGFGNKAGEADYNPRLDLSGNGEIDFQDFLIFAANFGSTV